jgi:hypothetical protein
MSAKQKVELFLVAPDGEHELGTFAVADGKVSGKDRRGISYEGTVVQHGENSVIELTAQIPKGTTVHADLKTEEANTVPLKFKLNPHQQAGRGTVPIKLPGFGVGDVKFVVS